jgi:hypothetical protein
MDEVKGFFETRATLEAEWQYYWTVFYTVSAAFAVFATSDHLPKERALLMAVVTTIAYGGFSCGNCWALYRNLRMRHSHYKFAESGATVGTAQEVIRSAMPMPLMWLIAYQSILVALVGTLLFLAIDGHKAKAWPFSSF